MTGFDDRFGAAPDALGSAGALRVLRVRGPDVSAVRRPDVPAVPRLGRSARLRRPPVFGTPAQPGQTWGTQPYQPTRTKTWGAQQIVTAVVVGIVALVALSFGWNYWQGHRALGVPASLGGVPKLTGSGADQVSTMASSELKDQTHGKTLAVAVYAAPASKSVVVLVGVRGKLKSVEEDLASGATGPRIQVGHNTCASFKGGVVCERTSAHLTEAVVAESATMSIPQVSAMLDEAWAHA